MKSQGKLEKTKGSADASRLNRDAWLDEAFKAVVAGGFDAVRVLVLADKLGVTRGSFYWHFTDHAELISALLARWRERELTLDKTLKLDTTDNPRADLERVLEAALAHTGVELENQRFELALRGLGRRDPVVAEMLAEVDQARLNLFERKFMRLTGDKKSASQLAFLFYLTIAGGHQALSRPGNPPQLKEYLQEVIGHYLIHQQTPRQSLSQV
jgi:AcrR family transcriptional regulator